jgi:hypothetical protein
VITEPVFWAIVERRDHHGAPRAGPGGTASDPREEGGRVGGRAAIPVEILLGHADVPEPGFSFALGIHVCTVG